MKEKQRDGLIVLGAVLLLISSQAFGQAQGEARVKTVTFQTGSTYGFLSSELSVPGKVVKGSPYSAQAVTEQIQVLADGNRIVRQTVSMVYRDSEGRTRREQQLPNIGLVAPEDITVRLISVHDPIEGLSYILNPSEKTARMSRLRVLAATKDGAEATLSVDDKGFTVVRLHEEGTGEQHREGIVEQREHEHRLSEAEHYIELRTHSPEEDSVEEALGSRMVQGVLADGTRTVSTIPAGKIGNELPIEIVTEEWFSEELQTVVLRHHSDPRFGETIFRLDNVVQEEPDPALFEVPADFTIEKNAASGSFVIRAREKRVKKNEDDPRLCAPLGGLRVRCGRPGSSEISNP